MNTRSFTTHIVFAFAAAVSCALALPLVKSLLGVQDALYALTGTVALAYALWIMGPRRTGLVTVALAAAVLIVAAALWNFSLWTWVLAFTTLIWLTRSIVRYRSVACSLADFALGGVALGGALWAAGQTHSLGWAVWTFFLVSAFSTLIPATLERRAAVEGTDDAFTRAHAAATTALERLQTERSTLR